MRSSDLDVLADYLHLYADGDGLRDEGSSLYMKLTTLQQTASSSVLYAHERTA